MTLMLTVCDRAMRTVLVVQAVAMVADLSAQRWIILLRKPESMKFTMCLEESCTNMEVAISLLLNLVCIPNVGFV